MKSLDPIDRRILSFLQENSRITIKEMASRLNVSTTPVFDRIKKMERAGVITKYAAMVDPKAIGKKLLAFIHISMKEHDKDSLDAFTKRVSDFDEILECFHVTGNSDFLLKVVSEDMETFNNFLTERFSLIPNIAHVNTSICLSTRKYVNHFDFNPR